MDYARYKDDYDRDGFVVVEGFLTSEELAELGQEIERFIQTVAPTLPGTQVFYEAQPDGSKSIRQIHRMSCDAYFDEYRRHPKWMALASALVGEPVAARPPFYFNKPPNTNFPTPPHQDNCAFGLDPPNATEILVATRERFDEESGCLRYVRGSHRLGMRAHAYSGVRGFSAEVADFGPDDEALEVAAEMNPGDVVCHHPLTIHRAMRNRSRSRSRSGFSMWFQGESAKVDQRIIDEYQRKAEQALLAGR